MASHTNTMALTLFLCLHFVFFTLVTSNYVPSPSIPPPSPTHHPVGPSTPTKPPPTHPLPATPILPTPPPTPYVPVPVTPPTPTLGSPTTPPPTPYVPVPVTPPTPTLGSPTTPPTKGDKCPINVLKLATCANVLKGLADVVLGIPPKSQCCTLLDGLTDLDAALCLCTALKANILGTNLNVPISLSVLLNFCNKAGIPGGFQCP